jgi:hypothetical protein
MAVTLETLVAPPKGLLFWSAPLGADSDFTPEDPLALDYLGQQVGLWLFRGLTTRTGRAQSYAVVLYGLNLAEKAVRRYGYAGDDETRTRLFERWERFWALATLECRDGQLARGDEDAMRGVRGAKRAWFPGGRPLPLDFPLISRQNELGSLGAYLQVGLPSTSRGTASAIPRWPPSSKASRRPGGQRHRAEHLPRRPLGRHPRRCPPLRDACRQAQISDEPSRSRRHRRVPKARKRQLRSPVHACSDSTGQGRR